MCQVLFITRTQQISGNFRTFIEVPFPERYVTTPNHFATLFAGVCPNFLCCKNIV